MLFPYLSAPRGPASAVPVPGPAPPILKSLRRRPLCDAVPGRGSSMRSERGTLRRYLVAAAMVVGALLLTLLLHPHLGPTPFLLFLIAVPAAAWYGGVGPGVVAAGLALALL